MARLAKFWNSTIICAGKFFGRSYTFELLGIWAGREEEERKRFTGQSPSITDAFKIVLNMVKNIGELSIEFKYSKYFSRQTETPADVLKQVPLILDPSNPYNNVMAALVVSPGQSEAKQAASKAVQKLFSDCAKETLKRVEALERIIRVSPEGADLKGLFLPQPSRSSPVGPSPSPLGPVPMPENWVISSRGGSNPRQPKLILRKKNMDEKKAEQLQRAFSAFMFASDIEDNYEISGEDKKAVAQKSVQRSIDHLSGKSPGKSNWGPTNQSHDHYDATFEIPIGREGKGTIIISCDWPETV